MMVALGFLSGGAARQVETDGIAVETVRFFRGDRTLVNGFVRVPHRLLAPLTVGPSGFAEFRLDVAVLDRAGTVLTRDGWSRQVDWGSTQAVCAATMVALAFAVAPGDYTIRVTVRDSASGRVQSAEPPL